MVSLCLHFGLLVASFGSFVVCDDRASLNRLPDVIRNNKESLAKMTNTLINLMQARQLGTCRQEIILKEAEMFQEAAETLSFAAATFSSLEISLRELTAQVDQNNCGQERRSTCSRSERQCGSGECIPERNYCDGQPDCEDSSDETTGCPVQCSEDEFKCEAENKCLPSHWVCDDEEDCSDGSDEETCPSVTTPTTLPGDGHRAKDPCTDHHCSHACLVSPLAPEGYTCVCPEGMVLFHDRLTCVVPFTKRPFVEYLGVKNLVGSPFSGVKS